MLETELEIAIKLAENAADAIMSFYESNVEVITKTTLDNNTEPVTIADKTASKIIVEGLINVFPDDGILSEEELDTDVRLTKQRVWMIDPIDGTKGFINRDGDFAVQIGLTENGEVILGVVLLPFHQTLYYASKGNGAFTVENGNPPKRLQVSDNKDFREMTIAVSRDHRSPRMNTIHDIFNLKNEVRRGSVGLKIGLIATRICDLYIHLSPRTKQWDSAAPEIILEESGGKLTDLFGEKIVYNTKDTFNYNGILATNGVSHTAAVAKLKPLLTEFGREVRRQNYGS
jgi:3'(2'), 5'-bisphosphate nucleotidase